MAKLADFFIEIGADMDGFKNAMKEIQGTMKKVGQDMKSAGANMTQGLTAPIAGLGAAVVVTTAKFESSMNRVAAVSGATGKEFDKLRDQAKDLGATTAFSASEAADGMSFLAMAGFEVEEIMSAMPGMLDLAAAAQMDLGAAADITSNIMSGFSIEATNAGHVADVLAKASASANTDVGQLGEAMKYGAPLAEALGISMEETAAAIGFMSDAGIQGSMAGTALRGGLNRLTKPTSEASKIMNELGINVFDSEGKMKSLSDITKTLNGAMGDMTAQEKAAAVATIFGQEAMSGWMAVMNRGGDELAGFTDELVNADGSAKDMADTMMGGMSGAFKELTSALEGAAIEFGEILAPVIEKVADAITGLIRWFSGLSKETKTVIAIIAGIVAVIGPLLFVLGVLMTVMGSLTAPIIAVVAGGAVLIAAFATLMTKSDKFRSAVSKAFKKVEKIATAAFDGIANTIGAAWKAVEKIWDKHGGAILSATEKTFGFIGKTIGGILTGIQTVVMGFFTLIGQIWTTYGATIMTMTTEIFGAIGLIIQTIIGTTFTFITTLWTALMEFWTLHGQTILQNSLLVFNTIYETIKTVLTLAWEIIQVIWAELMVFWTEHGQAILETTQTIFTNIYTAIENALTIAYEIITAALDLIMDFWNQHGERIMKLVTTIFKTVWDIMSGILKTITDVVSGVLSKIKNFWDKHGDAIMKIIKTAMKVIGAVIGTAMDAILFIFNTVWPIISGVVSTVWDTMKAVISGAVDVISGIIGFFVEIFTGDFAGAFEAVGDIVEGIMDSIVGIFKGAINLLIKGINGFIKGINKISFDIPGWVPVIGGKKFGFNIPKIPLLAEGGITTGPTLAMIGEGKEQEAVLPLSKLQNLLDINKDTDDKQPVEQDTEYHFEIPVQINEKEVGRATAKYSKQELDRKKRSRNRMKGRDKL
jgi:TP901 family phage tail tape measure protein